ncbi:hypothetical protein [Polymorphobacter fuscus]|uniref:hypothetical protein n=1 Tax=Sandarakinorhabdus fusca TaxID=1439888 RepID=UPI0012962AA8|nr:hypothetical protein [Polymorphobacter fuscus]NJC08729.1 F0F1-type ATP synthase assembly protein I [Polymorphobacter fuscus]
MNALFAWISAILLGVVLLVALFWGNFQGRTAYLLIGVAFVGLIAGFLFFVRSK